MSDLTDELKQLALMCANDFKRQNPDDSDEVDKAYARVKSFDGVICPVCWVKDGKSISLEVTALASQSNIYKCKLCGFSETLPNSA